MTYNSDNIKEFAGNIVKIKYAYKGRIHKRVGRISQIRNDDFKFTSFGVNKRSTIDYSDLIDIKEPGHLFDDEK